MSAERTPPCAAAGAAAAGHVRPAARSAASACRRRRRRTSRARSRGCSAICARIAPALVVVVAGRRDRHGVQRARPEDSRPGDDEDLRRVRREGDAACPAPAIDFDYVGRILLGLIGLYIVGNAFQYLMQYLMANVAQKTVYAMRREVEAKFDRLPLKFFDSRTRGEVMSRAVNDLDSISGTLQQNLTQLLTSVLTLIGVIVMMLTISWILTLVIVLTLPLSIVDRRAHREAVAEVLHEAADGARRAERPRRRDVRRPHDRHRVRPREASRSRPSTTLNENYYDGAWRAQFVSGIIMPTMMFVGNLGYVARRGDRRRARDAPVDRHRRRAGVHPVRPPVLDADHAVERHRQHDSADDRVGRARVRAARRAGRDAGCAERRRSIAAPRGAVQFDDVSFSYKDGRAAHRRHVASTSRPGR